MYNSERNFRTTHNPRETKCPHVIEFIQDTCKFYPGCDTITEEAYDKYVKYCKDRNYDDFGKFNTFARSFKYYILHCFMVSNLVYVPINYTAYKNGVGYIRKKGFAYRNLSISY